MTRKKQTPRPPRGKKQAKPAKQAKQPKKAALEPTASTAPGPEPQTVATLGDVAKHFGRSVHTVKKDWRPAWGDECGGPGAWDLAAIERWREETQRRSPGVEEAISPEQLSKVRQRKQIAETRIKEAEAVRRERLNRLAEAGVCFREDVEAFLSEFFRFLRDGIRQLAEDIKPEFPAPVREQLADSLRQRGSALLRSLKSQAERLAELDDAAAS